MVSGLSVVVPATDRPATLGRCTAALAAADTPADEVIVVEEPRELSASGARNVGAARASGDIVVFVDADVEVHRDALARIRAAFATQPDLTALYGSYDDTPDDRGTVSAFRNLLHHHVHQAGAGPAETFWTGLGAVRRTAFLAAGGFDEARYPNPSIEDIDLGRRLRAAGARVVLDPSIQGTHLKAWTLRSMLWTDFARRGVPWVALQLRSRRLSAALNCGWRHRLSAASCALGAAFAVLGLPRLALLAVVALLGLNHAFYALLARQLGPVQAVAGVVLHGAHHLVSVAAVPVGVAAALGAWAVSLRPRPAPALAAAVIPSATGPSLAPDAGRAPGPILDPAGPSLAPDATLGPGMVPDAAERPGPTVDPAGPSLIPDTTRTPGPMPDPAGPSNVPDAGPPSLVPDAARASSPTVDSAGGEGVPGAGRVSEGAPPDGALPPAGPRPPRRSAPALRSPGRLGR